MSYWVRFEFLITATKDGIFMANKLHMQLIPKVGSWMALIISDWTVVNLIPLIRTPMSSWVIRSNVALVHNLRWMRAQPRSTIIITQRFDFVVALTMWRFWLVSWKNIKSKTHQRLNARKEQLNNFDKTRSWSKQNFSNININFYSWKVVICLVQSKENQCKSLDPENKVVATFAHVQDQRRDSCSLNCLIVLEKNERHLHKLRSLRKSSEKPRCIWILFVVQYIREWFYGLILFIYAHNCLSKSGHIWLCLFKIINEFISNISVKRKITDYTQTTHIIPRWLKCEWLERSSVILVRLGKINALQKRVSAK